VKCLVTGATGFTGGHLSRALKRRGFEVRALVRPGSRTAALEADGVEIHEGQLTNADDVALAARDCAVIYNVAAVYRTAGHPDSHYYEVNVGGTDNVLAAARRAGCERVVHCSTGGVHGHIENPPAAETYRFKPDDVYQRSKLEAEMHAVEAIKQGQPVSIARPGAIYGEGDLRFLKLFRAIQKRRFLMIGPGKTRLHMVHVDDMVDGLILCGTKQEALGEVFIIAGPAAPTLNEIVATSAEILHTTVPPIHVPVWPFLAVGWACEMACVPFGIDPPIHRRRVGFFTHHREFDIGKARRLLGFAPHVSVREGLERTIRWYADEGHLQPF
jgi:nucleoside-diphosphate-sugar epimerase